MKKKITRSLGVLIMAAAVALGSVSAAFAGEVDMNEPSLYKVKNYVSGDCLLCSNAYMIKRMAMLMDSDAWKSITNDALRKAATVDGVNTVKSTFTYTADGIEYTVSRGSLSGSIEQRCEFVRTLLLEHPEGIVVWGGEPDTSYSGPHGVLVTGYNTDKSYLYVADSANNYNSNNQGITSWAGSIMFSIRYCSSYFYISSVRLTGKTQIGTIENTDDGKVKVSWKDIKGQNRYQISRTKAADKRYIAKSVTSKTATSTTLKAVEGSRYYRIRGINRFSYTDWMGVKHTNTVYGDWSDPKA